MLCEYLINIVLLFKIKTTVKGLCVYWQIYGLACSVLSPSKFIFNIRFQMAVLVCGVDTERNKNNEGGASSGTACLLEVCFFVFFLNST